MVDLLIEMKEYVSDLVYIRVIIERKYSHTIIEDLVKKVRNLINIHGKDNIKLTYIAQKIPWKTLKKYRDIPVVGGFLSVPTPKEYFTLAYKDWRRYIPIPKFLKRITPEKELSDKHFTMLDFV